MTKIALPIIPNEVTALDVGYWQTDDTTVVAIHDRTGREKQDDRWGEFLGHATLHEGATEDDVRDALYADGWTKGTRLEYTLTDVQGSATIWTR